MSDISDLSPKAQELYHKIMSGKYLTEQNDDIPLPMRRYFCQALHLVRSWFESHQDQMRLYCMNNTAGAIAILKEMEKNPDELMKGDFAEFPDTQPAFIPGRENHVEAERRRQDLPRTALSYDICRPRAYPRLLPNQTGDGDRRG